eukprot:2874992-Pyramimonas_sp.AAC.1
MAARVAPSPQSDVDAKSCRREAGEEDARGEFAPPAPWPMKTRDLNRDFLTKPARVQTLRLRVQSLSGS